MEKQIMAYRKVYRNQVFIYFWLLLSPQCEKATQAQLDTAVVPLASFGSEESRDDGIPEALAARGVIKSFPQSSGKLTITSDAIQILDQPLPTSILKGKSNTFKVIGKIVVLKGLFTIGEVRLKFLSIPNFKHRQYEAIFKQDDHFQTHIVHGIEQHTIFEERESWNLFERLNVIFLFPQNCIRQCL